MLARAAARAGARVTAVDASPERVARGNALCEEEGLGVVWHAAPLTRMPIGDGEHDAVVSLFGASYEPDPRAVADALARAVRPDGAIAFTAWTGWMAAAVHVATRDAVRPDRWARFETAYRHFFDFPELDVRPGSIGWTFTDADAAVTELSASGGEAGRSERVREALCDLVGEDAAGTPAGITLRAGFATIFARRPM